MAALGNPCLQLTVFKRFRYISRNRDGRESLVQVMESKRFPEGPRTDVGWAGDRNSCFSVTFTSDSAAALPSPGGLSVIGT